MSNFRNVIDFSADRCKCPPSNVLNVFVNTKHASSLALMEETLSRCGCNFKRIGKDSKSFGWNQKIGMFFQGTPLLF